MSYINRFAISCLDIETLRLQNSTLKAMYRTAVFNIISFKDCWCSGVFDVMGHLLAYINKYLGLDTFIVYMRNDYSSMLHFQAVMTVLDYKI